MIRQCRVMSLFRDDVLLGRAMSVSSGRQTGSYLMDAAARIAVAEAEAIAWQEFGIRGRAERLSGERDENFLIRTAEEVDFVLKIAHPSENARQMQFQTRALLHVPKRDSLLPVPRVLPARDGRHEAQICDRDGRTRAVRVVTYLPGVMAAHLPLIGPSLRRAVGQTLARLDMALADFADPADTFELSWDVTRCASLRPMLAAVAQPADRERAERALDGFERNVVPALPVLAHQVIHNDLTPFNVLVAEEEDSRIVGIIDFGDMIRAPRINDLAIACAYHIGAKGDPLLPLLDIVAAYCAEQKIQREECDLICDIVAARLAITILITEWHAAHNPENRVYILKNHPTAVRGLARLSAVPWAEAQARLRCAAGLEA